jgi:hypothetical protein
MLEISLQLRPWIFLQHAMWSYTNICLNIERF